MGNVYSRAADLDWEKKKQEAAAKRSNEPSFGAWALQPSLGNEMRTAESQPEGLQLDREFFEPRKPGFEPRKPEYKLLDESPPRPETPASGLRLRKPTLQDLTRDPFAPDVRGSATSPPPLFAADPLAPSSFLRPVDSPSHPSLSPDAVLPGPEKDSRGEEGSAGDVVSAVMGIDVVKKTVDDLTTGAQERFMDLPTGGKVATVGVGVALSALGIGVLATNPAANQKVGEWLDGKKFPVPGVPGLELQIFTKGRGGAGAYVDVVKLIQRFRKPRQKRRKKPQGSTQE